MEEKDGQNNSGRADKDGLYQIQEIRDTYIPPHAFVKPEDKEADELEGNNQPYGLFENAEIICRDISLKADKVGKIIRKKQEKEVQNHDRPKISIFDKIFHPLSFVSYL